MRKLTAVEAKRGFAHLLDTIQDQPTLITRRGKAVGFMLSPDDFAALQQGNAMHSKALENALRELEILDLRDTQNKS